MGFRLTNLGGVRRVLSHLDSDRDIFLQFEHNLNLHNFPEIRAGLVQTWYNAVLLNQKNFDYLSKEENPVELCKFLPKRLAWCMLSLSDPGRLA